MPADPTRPQALPPYDLWERSVLSQLAQVLPYYGDALSVVQGNTVQMHIGHRAGLMPAAMARQLMP